MGLTVRKYQRYLKFKQNPFVKSIRGRFPRIKRKSHHILRHCNKFRDELTECSFNMSKFKLQQKDNIPFGTLRNGKYHLEAHF